MKISKQSILNVLIICVLVWLVCSTLNLKRKSTMNFSNQESLKVQNFQLISKIDSLKVKIIEVQLSDSIKSEKLKIKLNHATKRIKKLESCNERAILWR